MNVTVLFGCAVIATVLEKLFEAVFTPLWNKFKWDSFYKLYTAMVVGTTIGMLSGLNAMPMFTAYPLIGRILTALFIGVGPSFLYDVIDKGKQMKPEGYIFEDSPTKRG